MRGELYPLLKVSTETRTRADTGWWSAKQVLTDSEGQLRTAQNRQRDERQKHRRRLNEMRQT